MRQVRGYYPFPCGLTSQCVCETIPTLSNSCYTLPMCDEIGRDRGDISTTNQRSRVGVGEGMHAHTHEQINTELLQLATEAQTVLE